MIAVPPKVAASAVRCEAPRTCGCGGVSSEAYKDTLFSSGALIPNVPVALVAPNPIVVSRVRIRCGRRVRLVRAQGPGQFAPKRASAPGQGARILREARPTASATILAMEE
eukprot:scaffold1315_cov405-Prasinococcus_capsulatus_cf.AAC.6